MALSFGWVVVWLLSWFGWFVGLVGLLVCRLVGLGGLLVCGFMGLLVCWCGDLGGFLDPEALKNIHFLEASWKVMFMKKLSPSVGNL